MNYCETFNYENNEHDEDTVTDSSSKSTNSSDISSESSLVNSIVRTWTMEYLWGRCKFLESSMIKNAPIENEDNIFCQLFEYMNQENLPMEKKKDLLKKNASRMIVALRERRSNCQESMKRDAIKSKSFFFLFWVTQMFPDDS